MPVDDLVGALRIAKGITYKPP